MVISSYQLLAATLPQIEQSELPERPNPAIWTSRSSNLATVGPWLLVWACPPGHWPEPGLVWLLGHRFPAPEMLGKQVERGGWEPWDPPLSLKLPLKPR